MHPKEWRPAAPEEPYNDGISAPAGFRSRGVPMKSRGIALATAIVFVITSCPSYGWAQTQQGVPATPQQQPAAPSTVQPTPTTQPAAQDQLPPAPSATQTQP